MHAARKRCIRINIIGKTWTTTSDSGDDTFDLLDVPSLLLVLCGVSREWSQTNQ